MRGQGAQNFLSDFDAVAQIIQTRILLFKGEWFENLNDGTPVFQSILGVPSTSEGVALILRERILGTPFVTGVQSLSIAYGDSGRTYTFTATVQTAFGTVVVTTPFLPGSKAVVTT